MKTQTNTPLKNKILTVFRKMVDAIKNLHAIKSLEQDKGINVAEYLEMKKHINTN